MTAISMNARRRTFRPAADSLETRRLLSGYVPTSIEQFFLQELNDARSNPAAYGASLGLDLSSYAPSQPLAMNALLVQAARQHSQDMFARNYFAHLTPDGLAPSQRVAAAGFASTGVAESIAYSYQSGLPVTNDASFQIQKATATLSDLIVDSGVPDLGHRKMLLDAGGQLRAFHQAGVGIDLEGPQPGQTWTDLTTIDMASTSDSRAFLTGVVFNDV